MCRCKEVQSKECRDGVCVKIDYNIMILRFWMDGGELMFEFSHLSDGAGKSFMPRMKVKGKNLGGVASWSSRISWRWSDVPEGAIRHSGSLRLRWRCRRAAGNIANILRFRLRMSRYANVAIASFKCQ